VAVKNFRLSRQVVKIGDALYFEFELVSKKKSTQKLMVDYRIHFAKKSGALLPKVFKLKELELKSGESIAFKKKQRFQDFTTRKHFPGKHRLEILVNGVVVKKMEFRVRS
jgi:hypothetical protein